MYGLENLEVFNCSGTYYENVVKFSEEIDNLPNLKNLYLRQVEFDENFSLKGFENLEFLSLDDITFTEKTSKDLFKNLKNLKEFHFSKGRIYSDFKDDLDLIKKLFQNLNAENATMNCQNEIIENIYSEPIPFLKNLKSLSVFFNKELENINEFFLLKAKSFPRLEELLGCIEEGGIEISGNFFKEFKNLKTLVLTGFVVESEKLDMGLSNYLFKNIYDFCNLTSLFLRNFPDNFTLGECFLQGLINLEELSLFSDPYFRYHDCINVSIDRKAKYLFKDLVKLKSLKMIFLDLYVIKSSYFDYLANLVELNLSYGEIQYIEAGSFKNLVKLQLLDLSSNNFDLIDQRAFAGLENLTSLNLIGGNRYFELTKDHLNEMGKLKIVRYV